ATVRAAQKMGVTLVTGCTGSPSPSGWIDYPPTPPELIANGLKDFARQWNPILDVCHECSVRFALVLHPAQVAYDLYTAEAALDALKGREEFGFTIDPSQLHWQGVDAVEFVRRFPDRVFHVHVRDAAVALNGRNSILGSNLTPGDPPRRWGYRAPVHRRLGWWTLLRALRVIR